MKTFKNNEILSIDSIDHTTLVKTSEAQSISGVKTFTSSPIIPTPTSNTQAANKSYVDSKTNDVAHLNALRDLDNIIEIDGSANLDTITTPGTYMNRRNTFLQNAPKNIGGFVLYVINYHVYYGTNGDVIATQQELHRDGNIWIRHKVVFANNGNWTEWKSAIEEDSGWKECELKEGFEQGALESAGNLMYRKIGNIVYIKGSVKGFTDDNVICAQLPENYRPNTRIDFYGSESGDYMAKFQITSQGNIAYLGGTRKLSGASQWFNLCTSFIVD